MVDPYADPHEVTEEYGITMRAVPNHDYVATIIAVAHDEYVSQSPESLCEVVREGGVFMDIKGLYDGSPEGYTYWRM